MADNQAASRPARRFPSAAQLTSGSNDDLCTVILETIEGRGLHLPPNKTSAVTSSLWTPQGTGAFGGRFLPWEPVRAGRNMRERVTAIGRTRLHGRHREADGPLRTARGRRTNGPASRSKYTEIP